MRNYLELCILAAMISILFGGPKLVFGLAGSLAELQGEVNTTTSYRGELENYIISHDIDLQWLSLSSLNMFELEKLVKAHMTECLSTTTPSLGHC